MALPKFPRNCMKFRKLWTVGGGGVPGVPPLRATTKVYRRVRVCFFWNMEETVHSYIVLLCTIWWLGNKLQKTLKSFETFKFR